MRAVLTYADYALLPDDGRRYEILGGELAVTPAPSRRHQRAVGALFRLLDSHVRAHALGEVYVSPFDVILDDTSVVQPDIVYVAAERLGIVAERGVEGAPSLAVEVTSPSTHQRDRNAKRELYARHGVPHVWIVDPEARTIDAYVLHGGAYALAVHAAADASLRAEPFPDLEILTRSLWA
jgi:Uma2 family endonuclease